MNKREAIAYLEKLKEDCKEFVSIETKKGDVQALELAISALKETAQEVPVQEQLELILTSHLINELSKRIGVSKFIVEPYELKDITFEGPAIVLEVID